MKLAIVGAGMIVKGFLSMVVEIPEIKLQAIIGTDMDIDVMNQLKEKYSIKSVYTDLEQSLVNEDVDTVYVAVPNHLHYSFAKKALQAGKNVICEKPFTLNLRELEELRSIALEKNLVLLEAITNQYLSNYKGIQDSLKKLGTIKVIECNYSQYSSRYNAFKEGTILPAFNPKFGGGALMDLNIYNIHFVVGLLGMPKKVNYFANIAHEVDTSGVLIMDYESIKVVSIGAKDSTADIHSTIQGEDGSIVIDGPTNVIDKYTVHLNKQQAVQEDHKVNGHRMFEEFKTFNKVIAEHDMTFVEAKLNHSLKVMQVVDLARKSAGLS